jgi:hypothetical protein
MIRLTLIFTILLVASCPSWAGDPQNRFVEFPSEIDTLTFDLDTVQIIAPGRFAIMSTTIDNPDVMKFELNALEILKPYCARPDGEYPAPSDLFQLGQPDDLPVEQIKVKTFGSTLGKSVAWKYPYRRFRAQQHTTLQCKYGDSYNYNTITNGFRQKEIFDCKRGLLSFGLSDEGDDPHDAYMMPVKNGTNGALWYSMVCRAVTHEEPYLPE